VLQFKKYRSPAKSENPFREKKLFLFFHPPFDVSELKSECEIHSKPQIGLLVPFQPLNGAAYRSFPDNWVCALALK
jgi:hypothetical protein